MDFAELTAQIDAYSTITVFRHEHPDCDALGSQFGFVNWLRENYPDKQILALGEETTDQAVFPPSDTVSDETIQKSLALIVDTSNLERVDDQRCRLADKIIKIDHHPDVEPFGTVNLVNDHAAATCEILTDYFDGRQECIFSKTTAEYLYKGLLTDTLCYSTSNTTSNTLSAGASLAKKGIHIPDINQELFDQPLAAYRFSGYVRSHTETVEGKLAYMIFRLEDQQKCHISGPSARNFVSEMGHVKDFQIWCIFTEREEDGKRLFDGSLRSKSIVINDLAQQYNGGGHPNASGVKNLNENMMKTLIESLFSRIK